MSSASQHLGIKKDYGQPVLDEVKEKRFAIVTAEWNDEITEALRQGAVDTLSEHGITEENIVSQFVPGSYELTLAAQWMAARPDIDAVLCLGCVVQGETRHFDFICDAVATGLMQVNMRYSKPVVFGVLTTENQQQAKERAGGSYGNKGSEAALTALKMLSLRKNLDDSEAKKPIGFYRK